MPSFFTIAAFAALFTPIIAGTPSTCANSASQLSCSVSSTNTCCINSPGGLLQQVQFWDTNPATGPSNSWTIHGLWPNNCDGTYSENCDSSRAYTDITTLLTNAGKTSTLSTMQTYWLSDDESEEKFWEVRHLFMIEYFLLILCFEIFKMSYQFPIISTLLNMRANPAQRLQLLQTSHVFSVLIHYKHEWSTHGTCISTLKPSCYTSYTKGEEAVDFFTKVVSLFQGLPTYTVRVPPPFNPNQNYTSTNPK